MTIVENSILAGFFLRLWHFLQGAWSESALRRGCACAARALCRWVQGSALCRFVWRDGVLLRSWPGSLIRSLFAVILNLPCAIVRWIYRVGKRIWDGSLVCSVLSFCGGLSSLFLGLFLMVMLIAPHGMWNNLYGLLGVLGVLVLFVLGCPARARSRLETDILGPYMVFYLMCIGCAFLASLSSRLSLRFFLFHLTSFLLVVLVVSTVRKPNQLKLLLGLAVAGLTVAALYGCYQGYVGVEVVASQQDMTVNYGMPGRVYSFFDNPNNFAELLVMLLPLDIGLLFAARGWRGRLAAALALIPCVGAIGLTYSRSGWIGLALAVMVFIALENWKLVPVMLALGVCAIPFLPKTIYNRILTIGNMKDSSTSYRFAIYDASATLMKDYWYRGVGLGTDVMQRTFRAYPAMFDGSFPIHTHNNYLQMWGETGILGLISYLGVLLYGLKTGVKAYYKGLDPALKHILAAALGAFCGILVIGIAEYTWFYPRNMFVYWFLFGVILCCAKLGRSEKKA